MQNRDVFSARAELKFLDDEPSGTIGGLGAVFGNVDSHGDVIMPGAFAESLVKHKGRGSMPRMYLNHSIFTGGSPLTVGVWTEIEEVSDGLRVKGRLFDVPHPEIQLLKANLSARQVDGLSIAYSIPAGGAVLGKRADEPKRTLKTIDLVAVDIVGDPSNPLARIDTVKSVMTLTDVDTACAALSRAAAIHRTSLAGGNSPTVEQRNALIENIQAAHVALRGEPIATKFGFDTIREFEDWLHRDPEDGGKGLSNAKAREIGNLVFKSLHRDDGRGQAEQLDKEVVNSLTDALGDFSLPSF